MEKTPRQLEIDFERDFVKALLSILYDMKLITTFELQCMLAEHDLILADSNSTSQNQEKKSNDRKIKN